MSKDPISKTDMAMIKLTYTDQEFGLLEAAVKGDPALVADYVAKVKPVDFNDTKAYDRIVCSLFVNARDEWENDNVLPLWAEEWFDKFWPNQPYHQFYDIDIFNTKSRYDKISLVS